MSVRSNLSASTGATASTRNQLGLDAFYLLPWNNWFYGGLGNFLQSSEQGINRQGTAGGGIGRYLKDTNLARISVLAGFAGQNTEYQQSNTSQKLASGLIAANFQFFQFNKTNATVATVFLPVISQPGPVKFNLSATYYIKITGSPAICLGVSRSTATGIAGRRMVFPVATTAPARDSAGHLATSIYLLGRERRDEYTTCKGLTHRQTQVTIHDLFHYVAKRPGRQTSRDDV